MSTSNILLGQNFNANDVDIMVFEPSVLLPQPPPPPPRRSLGEIDDMVQLMILNISKIAIHESTNEF